MKSISFKVEDKLKKQVEQMAKKHRMSVSKLMHQLISNAFQKGEAATTLYDSDKDLILSTIKNFTKKGLKAKHMIETEMTDSEHLLYIPNAWLLEVEDAVKMIGANEEILKRLKIRDYALLDKNHILMKRALKSYNYRAKEKADSSEELVEKVFRRKSDAPLILVEKLDPLKLSKFCKIHSDKKVYYLLGTQDVKVNRQVS